MNYLQEHYFQNSVDNEGASTRKCPVLYPYVKFKKTNGSKNATLSNDKNFTS